MLDTLLFGVLPYVALAVALVVSLYRYFSNRYSFSSQSSQFLESGQLFWGSVPWHYGIIIVLMGHIIGLVLPGGVQAFNGVPLRLYVLEGTGLALGILALFGILVLTGRRIGTARLYAVTTPMDVVLLILLISQVALGVWVAIFDRWGSLWYVSNAVPYLRSLAGLSPEIGYVTTLPFMVKLHIINAMVLTAVFPFTRLVHLLSLPITYLWRPNQVVVWNRRPVQSPSRSERPAPAGSSSDGGGL